MALPVKQQLTYWGIATALFLVSLWLLGEVLAPFLVGGAIAYFLDPVADLLAHVKLAFHLQYGAWILICQAYLTYGPVPVSVPDREGGRR